MLPAAPSHTRCKEGVQAFFDLRKPLPRSDRPMTRQALLAVLVLALPWNARAQGDASGVITGYAVDQAGNALRGITITVRSPTQIGGPRKTTTSSEGFFRIPAL